MQQITGIHPRTVLSILDRAVERGLDLTKPVILDIHVQDAPRPGRPAKQADVRDEILQKVRRDRYGREKSCALISSELGGRVSPITVWRVLRTAGLQKTKPTRKPGLTVAMRKARLEWCLAHAHWTLEDWKLVIWLDETAVVLLHRRGGYRVWRLLEERMVRSCIRERWKGYTEFMFWGSFSYDKKGPCHVWKPETARERAESERAIEKLNEEIEPLMKEMWEIENGVRRLGVRSRPGPRPEWKWTRETGKLSRGKGSGIDWWRYQQQIIIPKLIPFAKEIGPGALVQEDNAPSHRHHVQSIIYSKYQVQKMTWVANSPDLNMIEAAWPYMKRNTTKRGAPKSLGEATTAWVRTWEEMPQSRIQAWIERIPHHIQEVIRLEGGNNYIEGRKKDRRPETGVVIDLD